MRGKTVKIKHVIEHSQHVLQERLGSLNLSLANHHYNGHYMRFSPLAMGGATVLHTVGRPRLLNFHSTSDVYKTNSASPCTLNYEYHHRDFAELLHCYCNQ